MNLNILQCLERVTKRSVRNFPIMTEKSNQIKSFINSLYVPTLWPNFSRSFYVSPLILEVFISHQFGLLMGTMEKCTKVEIYSYLPYIMSVAAFRQEIN